MQMRDWIHYLACACTLATLPAASLAAPPTAQEKFESKVERFTNDSSFVDNPKRLCVCIADNNADDERMAGVMVDTIAVGADNLRRIQVRCFVRRFSADGSNVNSEACQTDWHILR
jgi:hypothetical protein